MLDSLGKLQGIQRAVLTGLDGLVIESVGEGSPPAEMLAAELATILRVMEPITRTLGGELRRFTLAADNYEILAVCFKTYCVGAVIERSADRRIVGSELSGLALKLSEDL